MEDDDADLSMAVDATTSSDSKTNKQASDSGKKYTVHEVQKVWPLDKRLLHVFYLLNPEGLALAAISAKCERLFCLASFTRSDRRARLQ